MLLPIVLTSTDSLNREQFITEILKMNDESGQYGLVLTSDKALELLEARNRSLQQLGRVELGFDVPKMLIHFFCNSSYIRPEDYFSTLTELQEIFYFVKNETEDQLGDEALIKMMKDEFENNCGGSLELLKGRLTSFAEDFRKKLLLSLTPKED